MVIIPATFTGRPRHMYDYAQDATTYIHAYSCQIYSSHSHAILRGMKLRNILCLDNRLRIAMTLSHVCSNKNCNQ